MTQFQMDCIELEKKNVRNLYGRFKISPLLQGQGYTVGNALRRTLLSNILGTAISGVRIAGIPHEYSTITGIREDVLEILLNLKDIVLICPVQSSQVGRLKVQGPLVITASHLELPGEIKLVDPRQYIATITQKISFEMECRIDTGYGYTLVEQSSSTDFFNIDSVFMPVKKIGIKVDEINLTQEKRGESLTLDITTNGSIQPRKAIEEGAKILISLLTPLQAFPETSYEIEVLPEEMDYQRILIEELQLSVRAYNCLKRAKIHTMSDLLLYSQKELLEIKNFGLKSVNEVINALEKRLGITLPPLPKNME